VVNKKTDELNHVFETIMDIKRNPFLTYLATSELMEKRYLEITISNALILKG
jgi:hypothetical protein